MAVLKSDVKELANRMNIKKATITNLTYCFVDSNKNCSPFQQLPFDSLSENEKIKFLDIAKKSLSGNIGQKILELHFQDVESDYQPLFDTIRTEELKNESTLKILAEKIANSYEYGGNYMIIFFADTYDIPPVDDPEIDTDESSEIFSYFLCSICHVELQTLGLCYNPDVNFIRIEDSSWTVNSPDVAFAYPAFAERSADTTGMIFYTKKDAYPKFISDALGCSSAMTKKQELNALNSVLKQCVGNDKETIEAVKEKLQTTEITPETLTNIIAETVDSDEDVSDMVSAAMSENFGENYSLNVDPISTNKPSIQIKVPSEDMVQIATHNGERCLIIPLAEGVAAEINGVLKYASKSATHRLRATPLEAGACKSRVD